MTDIHPISDKHEPDSDFAKEYRWSVWYCATIPRMRRCWSGWSRWRIRRDGCEMVSFSVGSYLRIGERFGSGSFTNC